MRSTWKYSIISIIVLVVIIFVTLRIRSAANSAETRRSAAPLVRVQKPVQELLKVKLSYTGDVLPIQQANIYSKVSGNLERNYVEMGTLATTNQLLATIDSTELFQQYQQTNATYQNNRLLFERSKQLFEKKLASQQDVDNAEATMKVAKANYDAAATHLSYAKIIAPFTGFITRRFLDAGALVNASTSTLFTMMNLDSVKIIVYVPEKDLSQMYKVRIAAVTMDALPGMQFTGHVSRFSESVDLATRTMPVEIDIPNRTRIIKPGMFATVTFVTQEIPDALMVPSDALLKDDQGYFVFISDGKTAHLKRITIGDEQESRTHVLSGIESNDDIISTGQQFVKDGSPLTILK